MERRARPQDAPGPMIGPRTAPVDHTPIAYGSLLGRKISPIEAPPVARIGEPKKPVRKRKMRRQVRFFGRTIGIWRRTKRKRPIQ